MVSRWISLAVFAVTAALLSVLLAHFVHLALDRLPTLLDSLLPKLDELFSKWGINLTLENAHDLKTVLLDALKDNVRSVTQESGLLTKGFFQILASILVAILCFFSGPAVKEPPSLYATLSRELATRAKLFMQSFEKVLGSQVVVSLINTFVTAIFLLWIGLPYFHFLVLATFIFGIIPIVGNLITNTMIIGTALTISPHLALFTLACLSAFHQLNYLITGRIIGRRMHIPVWQILLGPLIGESLLGTTGMILAPAVVYYLREEMRALPTPEGL